VEVTTGGAVTPVVHLRCMAVNDWRHFYQNCTFTETE